MLGEKCKPAIVGDADKALDAVPKNFRVSVSNVDRLLLKAVFEMGLLSIANDTDEIPVETEKFPTAPKSHGELTNKPGK